MVQIPSTRSPAGCSLVSNASAKRVFAVPGLSGFVRLKDILTVRRGFVEEKYAPLVSALFDGAPNCKIETQVKFEDGRTGVISADIAIRDVEFVSSGSERQAA